MNYQLLATETFSAGRRYYFLDFKRAEKSGCRYIQFTRSEQQHDGSFKRCSFLIFEDHFEDFVAAFSSLFRSVAYLDKDNTTVQQMREEAKGEAKAG